MYIVRFLLSCKPEASPQLAPVVNDCMYNRSDECSEAQSIVERKSRCQEHRRVFLILGKIEGIPGAKNLGDIVLALGVVKRRGCVDGQVGRVEGTSV